MAESETGVTNALFKAIGFFMFLINTKIGVLFLGHVVNKQIGVKMSAIFDLRKTSVYFSPSTNPVSSDGDHSIVHWPPNSEIGVGIPA